MTSSKAPPKAKVQQSQPGGDAARTHMYSRFIPREELSSFAAWSPGDLDGGARADHGVRAARAEAPAADPAAVIAAQLRAARQAGYQDGYRDGLVALEGFKQSFASQTTTQVGTIVRALGEQLGELQQEMARTIARSAVLLARQVIRSELEARPELVARIAEEAIDALVRGARHVTVRLHPDDHALVEAGAAEAIGRSDARLIADPGVGRGGCVVESDVGLIDATIEERWRRAAALVGNDEAWGAPEVDERDEAAPAA